MSSYNKLLAKAMEAVREGIRKKTQIMMQMDRGAKLPMKKNSEPNQFELITWLVIL